MQNTRFRNQPERFFLLDFNKLPAVPSVPIFRSSPVRFLVRKVNILAEVPL